MSTEMEMTNAAATTDDETTEAPSAEWVKAVSEYLDTDPADLLAELGYYDRSDEEPSTAAEPSGVARS